MAKMLRAAPPTTVTHQRALQAELLQRIPVAFRLSQGLTEILSFGITERAVYVKSKEEL